MSVPLILSGKEVSQSVYESLEDRIASLNSQNIIPGLAAVLVGDDPASHVYVRSKTKIFNSLSLHTETFRFSSDISEGDLLEAIGKFNLDSSFHGILVQLPLPKHINSQHILRSIRPDKDCLLYTSPSPRD